jgi:hypothetical protein
VLLAPTIVCHCLRLPATWPHRKTQPQPQAVPCNELATALLGVVVAKHVWKPVSNSKQWHTLRVHRPDESGAVQLARIIHEFEPVCHKIIVRNELEPSCPEHHVLVGGLSSEHGRAGPFFVSGMNRTFALPLALGVMSCRLQPASSFATSFSWWLAWLRELAIAGFSRASRSWTCLASIRA